MKNKLLISLAIAAGMAVSAAASATTINFYTGGNDQNLGASHDFDGLRVDGFTYTSPFADSTNPSNYAAADLWQRNTGGPYAGAPGEWGLGVGTDSRHGEIDPDEFLKFDFGNSSLASNFFNGDLRLTIGSLQDGEQVEFWIGDPLHSNSMLFDTLTGTAGGDVSFIDIAGSEFLRGDGDNNGFNDLYIVGRTDDVLLQSLTTIAAVPEPSALMMFALGLLGLGVAVRLKNSRS